MSMEPSNFDAHVGQRLLQLRTERQLSVAQLSEKSGLPSDDLVNYEHGVKRIQPNDLWELSKILRVDVGAFFDGLQPTYSDAS